MVVSSRMWMGDVVNLRWGARGRVGLLLLVDLYFVRRSKAERCLWRVVVGAVFS